MELALFDASRCKILSCAVILEKCEWSRILYEFELKKIGEEESLRSARSARSAKQEAIGVSIAIAPAPIHLTASQGEGFLATAGGSCDTFSKPSS
jgi:hypothetical protein